MKCIDREKIVIGPVAADDLIGTRGWNESPTQSSSLHDQKTMKAIYVVSLLVYIHSRMLD